MVKKTEKQVWVCTFSNRIFKKNKNYNDFLLFNYTFYNELL